MSRRVPAQPTHTIPRRATVPTGDLRLPDGRTLFYAGPLHLRQAGAAPVHGAHWGSDEGMGVIASLDATPHGRLLHVSLSYADHLPTWDDIKAVRAAFYPADVDCAMMLPAEKDYVNVHAYTMHLWQLPVAWGIR
jgi:hypothetical protein